MILYFSGTNNSRHIAEALAKRLDETVISLGDARRQGRMHFTLKKGEKLGFVMPVHGWNLPYIVSLFFKEAVFEGYDNQYIYGVFTCGANDGLASADLAKLLAAKGMKLNASFAFVMPDTYIPFFDVPSPAEQKTILKAADDALPAIAERIRQQEAVIIHTPKNPPRWFSYLAGKAMQSGFRYPNEFRVSDACISCGRCAENCPMNTITMVDGKPRWAGDCTKCLKCIHYCPVKAIDMGKKTRKRGRYHHPDYPLP